MVVGLALGLVSAAVGQDSAAATAAPAVREVKTGKFTLTYHVQGANLVASVSYPTKGWVGIGFNPSDRMKDADFIIGCVFDDGRVVVGDEFGVGATKHMLDTEVGGADNLIERSCVEKDGVTTMSFTIPLNSGDSKDRVLVVGSEVKVILAAGRKDTFGKHSSLARTKITL